MTVTSSAAHNCRPSRGPEPLCFQRLAASKAGCRICGGHGWLTVVRPVALMVSVQGAPELPRALPATAARFRSKPPLAWALGAWPWTMLPVWAVASPVSVASPAFIGGLLHSFVAAAQTSPRAVRLARRG